ncbi:MAG: hypothetical protein AAFR90_08030, partial [Pseudomonadota bacterium]
MLPEQEAKHGGDNKKRGKKYQHHKKNFDLVDRQNGGAPPHAFQIPFQFSVVFRVSYRGSVNPSPLGDRMRKHPGMANY